MTYQSLEGISTKNIIAINQNTENFAKCSLTFISLLSFCRSRVGKTKPEEIKKPSDKEKSKQVTIIKNVAKKSGEVLPPEKKALIVSAFKSRP